MRLIFFYLAHRNGRYYLEEFFPTEGYYWLLKRMIETEIVDEVIVIAESGKRFPAVEYMPGFTGHVVPSIEDVPGGLREDDIIWVRGGWKSWFSFLEKISPDHWLLFYGANTGRGRWPFWDVIFNDLAGRDYVDNCGRIHFDFRKPTHPEIFYPMVLEREYDLCIGASHIHDKKGQWRGIKAVMACRDIFVGEKLKCILPGAFRRGVMTNDILDDIRTHDLDVALPGMLSRDELRSVYNQSKLFIHLGSGGQGDRGVLEAMRCGCPIMVGFPEYHAPFTYQSELSYVAADPHHLRALAYEIHKQIKESTGEKRLDVFQYHEIECGVETNILPRMKKLFSILRDCPKAGKGVETQNLAPLLGGGVLL